MPALPPVSDALKRAFDPAQFAEAAAEASEALAGHLERAQQRHAPSSYPAPSPEQERAHWQNEASWTTGRKGMHDQVIARSNHLHDPRYMGHQVAAVLPEAATTGMVTDMLNNGQAIYEMGPSNATQEDLLMSEIGEQLGLPSGCGGVLCHPSSPSSNRGATSRDG